MTKTDLSNFTKEQLKEELQKRERKYYESEIKKFEIEEEKVRKERIKRARARIYGTTDLSLTEINNCSDNVIMFINDLLEGEN